MDSRISCHTHGFHAVSDGYSDYLLECTTLFDELVNSFKVYAHKKAYEITTTMLWTIDT